MADTKQIPTHDPSEKVTVIEDGTEFKGTMTSTCAVVVRGKIEGELSMPALSVAATGIVQGRARVGTIDSSGQLSGEFDAETVRLSGAVSDDTIIRAKTLEVKLVSDGKMVVSFGESRLEVGEAPQPPK
jgi:cytoskeletal protein CcmA (bactofilin family)